MATRSKRKPKKADWAGFAVTALVVWAIALAAARADDLPWWAHIGIGMLLGLLAAPAARRLLARLSSRTGIQISRAKRTKP